MVENYLPSAKRIDQFEPLEENVKVLYKENSTYKIILLKEPNEIYQIEIYVYSYLTTFTNKLHLILNYLINSKHQLGIVESSPYTLVVQVYCLQLSYKQVVNSIKYIEDIFVLTYPFLSIRIYDHKILLANYQLPQISEPNEF
jgi:hypothetical protein